MSCAVFCSRCQFNALDLHSLSIILLPTDPSFLFFFLRPSGVPATIKNLQSTCRQVAHTVFTTNVFSQQQKS